LFINLTNDSWSKTNSAEIQHFVAARFRSVEARRVLVRSTNGGVSGIVMPDGSVRDLLPLFTATARLVDIPVYTGETTSYMLFGDWFVATLALLLAGLLLLVVSGDLKTRKAHSGKPEGNYPFHYSSDEAILESEAPITMQAEDSDERP
jgi:apolipoprotein N-acyltransferase